MDYDKTKLPETYAKSRQLSAETETLWMDAMAVFLPICRESENAADECLSILDLGSGTGRFTAVLAERFNATVVGVEPSEKMRRQAEANANAQHQRVTYIAGSAEKIPCQDASFDTVFCSMVVHHFLSIPDACRELFRVLRPGGIVFVRTDLKEGIESVRFYDFFPTAKALAMERAPTVTGLSKQFEAAGFVKIHHGIITQQIDPSLSSHYERIKLRGVSSLESLTEEEFLDGIEQMRRAAEAEVESMPVMEGIGVVVFQKRNRVANDG